MNPRGKKVILQPSVYCALYLKIIVAFRHFLKSTTKKLIKELVKLFSTLEDFYSSRVGRMDQIKANCKLNPNCLYIIWNFSSSCFYQCCLSSELIMISKLANLSRKREAQIILLCPSYWLYFDNKKLLHGVQWGAVKTVG